MLNTVRLILIFCFTIPTLQGSDDSIWDYLISKRHTLLSFPFKNGRPSVWKDNGTREGRGHDQFYVTPLPEFLPQTVERGRSFLKEAYKVSFYIQMWDQQLQDAAISAISEHLHVRPEPKYVQPLPFRKVLIFNTPLEALIFQTTKVEKNGSKPSNRRTSSNRHLHSS